MANSVLPALGHCLDSVQFNSPRGLGSKPIVSSQPWSLPDSVKLDSPKGSCSRANSVLPALGIVLTVSSWIAPEVRVPGK